MNIICYVHKRMNNVYSFPYFQVPTLQPEHSISCNDIIYNFIYLLQPNGSPSLKKLLSVPVNVKKVGYSDL